MIFKNAKLLSGNIVDIAVKNGIIQKIAKRINIGDQTEIDLGGNLLLPGFIDMHVHLRDPGFTHKEDIISGTKAAARGGYTTIASMPNTNPVIDDCQKYNEFKNRCERDAKIRVIPIPAMTIGSQGKQLADFSAFKIAGILAITDDGKGIEDDLLMERIVQRAGEQDLIIMQHAEFKRIAANGVINAGSAAERLHLPGILPAAEIEMVRRDLSLAKRYKAKYHLQHVSLAESLKLVLDAKKNGVDVTSEITPHHLLLTEDNILVDDANYKMNPPLRSITDRDYLVDAFNRGLIDMISTDHAPHTVDEKKLGFIGAPFGIVGLEIAFPLLYTQLVLQKKLSLDRLVDGMTKNPAACFELPYGNVEEGAFADLVVVDLNLEKKVDINSFVSKGKNTPFHGALLKGWPVLTIYGGEIVHDELQR